MKISLVGIFFCMRSLNLPVNWLSSWGQNDSFFDMDVQQLPDGLSEGKSPHFIRQLLMLLCPWYFLGSKKRSPAFMYKSILKSVLKTNLPHYASKEKYIFFQKGKTVLHCHKLYHHNHHHHHGVLQNFYYSCSHVWRKKEEEEDQRSH